MRRSSNRATVGRRGRNFPALRAAKGQSLAARCRGDVPPYHHPRSRSDANRIYVAISAAGAFRSEDGGQDLAAHQSGPRISEGKFPDPDGRGRSLRPPHRNAPRPHPNVLYHAEALGRDAQRGRAAHSWHEVSGNLPSDFGFPIAVHAHEPETIYVVPIKSDSEHYPPEGKLRVYRSRTGGNEWEALTKGLPQADCYHNILRDAMAVDTLDECGIYFGTTGGKSTHPPTGVIVG